ncbi:MAG: phosphoribosylglycinamide formyltransferase [Burkholderiaceae bacterium]
MKSLVILISGRGSNMLGIARACAEQGWPARVAAVISNDPNAAGLSSAAALGLPTEALSHKSFPSRDAFDAALVERIDAYRPDLVVMAGFMRVLGAAFVDHFQGRLINIHPSLLPAFPGLDTHARALAAGVRVHGATAHFVTPDLDAGPIIAQVVVPVFADDSPASLRARVQIAEHRLYPAVVRGFVEGLVALHGDRVLLAEGMSAAMGLDDGPSTH